MINEETKKLLEKRESNDLKIKRLKNKNAELTSKICRIEGYCPYCRNWHYPHCDYN